MHQPIGRLPSEFLALKDILDLAVDAYLKRDAETCITALSDLCVKAGTMHADMHERRVKKVK